MAYATQRGEGRGLHWHYLKKKGRGFVMEVHKSSKLYKWHLGDGLSAFVHQTFRLDKQVILCNKGLI